MQLKDLIGPYAAVPGDGGEIEIGGLTADSRQVEPGYLFAALPGTNVDGAKFIPAAIEAGASAILAHADTTVETPEDVAIIRAQDPRRVLALIAARFSAIQPEIAVAVTGTSGKTSVAEFTRQIFAHLGHQSASLGTIGLVRPGGEVEGALTTPDPVALHALLAKIAGEGVTHVAFEASSHGLDQHRLDGVKLTAAAFTNLGRDHLDYHPTIEDYFAAKLRLFSELLEPGRTAVINADCPRAADVVIAAGERGLQTYSVGARGNDLRLVGVERIGFKQRLTVAWNGRETTIDFPLVGAYQVANALVAAGLCIATGEDTEAVLNALQSLRGVNGRLDIVGETNGALIVIDYAHKPEALEAALDAVRPFVTGKLVCVFGCGGDRDKGKRPLMGKIAAEKADSVYVTDDNPRTEDAAGIRAQILAASPRAQEIGDRREAIHAAIATAARGDVVLIAGKGHETGQKVGDVVHPFSDHDVATEAIGNGSTSND